MSHSREGLTKIAIRCPCIISHSLKQTHLPLLYEVCERAVRKSNDFATGERECTGAVTERDRVGSDQTKHNLCDIWTTASKAETISKRLNLGKINSEQVLQKSIEIKANANLPTQS